MAVLGRSQVESDCSSVGRVLARSSGFDSYKGIKQSQHSGGLSLRSRKFKVTLSGLMEASCG